MAANPIGIGNLPNEILILILETFVTLELLPLTTTCGYFHEAILQIIQRRLLAAASSRDHKLILECYHPSAKFHTPYLYCDYVGTPRLDQEDGGSDKTGSLGKLSNLYSYFRPLKPDSARRTPRQHPDGGWPALPLLGLVNKHQHFVCQEIYLDSHELFSQLVTTSRIVRLGPKPGVYLSSAIIGQGVMRIWRDWLAEHVCDEANAMDAQLNRDKRLVWSGSQNNVGIRMKVVERRDGPAPLLLRGDEDPAVSYTLQYEEVAIRTSHLLLMVEESVERDMRQSGRAVVIGSWIK